MKEVNEEIDEYLKHSKTIGFKIIEIGLLNNLDPRKLVVIQIILLLDALKVMDRRLYILTLNEVTKELDELDSKESEQ